MKIDTPVVVWDSPAFGRHNRHFAGWTHDGKIEVWRSGRTSFSGTTKKTYDNWEAASTNGGQPFADNVGL